MKPIVYFLLLLILSSCIPIRVAPNISTHKVTIGKKFKNTLPKEYVFIFEDNKDADEFYNYINAKFQRNYLDVEYNSSFTINGKQYYLSFYEVEIPDKKVNLVPIAVDLATRNSNFETDFSDSYSSRKGNWYIAISVSDEDLRNCLDPIYPLKQSILDYLIEIRSEYLNTNNYNYILTNKKP